MNLGQLFFIGIEGYSLTDKEREFIEKNDIGGVILFERNIESAAQIGELINSIQILRENYPLFIGVDHEGGRVHRFKDKLTKFPPMRTIGDIDSPKITFHVHKAMAEELLACGLNINFAPVCDILLNPDNKVIGDRAFGEDKDVVERHISAAIRGLQTNGIMGCAKHFPGHGTTLKDSHFNLPHLTKSLEQLEECEIYPFVKAVKSRVNFMMVAHMVVDAFNKDVPCSLAKECYDYMRKKLKYNRPIITDDLEMKAITEKWSVEDAAVKALQAGADILLFQNIDTAISAFERVSQAVKVKEILKSDIEDKLKRITNTKKEYFKDFKPVYIPDIKGRVKTRATEVFLEDILAKQ